MTNKVFEVCLIDEWNNTYLIGFYKDLDDSIDDINNYIINDKYKLKKGDIKIYPTIYGWCFDTYLSDIFCEYGNEEYDAEADYRIFGYILDGEEVIERIKRCLK